MLNMVWNLVVFIVTLSILVIVHEFGHFYVARRCGVRVECFSIGFGRPLWRYTDRYGTKFFIALIPFGGYVKMLNEHTETSRSKIDCSAAFNRRSTHKQAAIIASGPVANFLFTIFTYWIVFLIGLPGIRPVVGEVIANSIAENAQIMPDMELQEIDGVPTPDWNAVRLQLLGKIGDAQATINISLFGSNQKQTKILDLQNWSFEPYKDDPIVALGILPHYAHSSIELAEVNDFCAAQKAGLQVGDRIIKVNGKPLTNWMTFVNLVRNNPGQPLMLEIKRNENLLSLVLIPDTKIGSFKPEGFAGLVPKVIPLSNEYHITRQYRPFGAIIEAVSQTWRLIKLTVSMLGKLISSKIKPNNLRGPISVARGARVSAESGMIYYLMFLGLISVNLGIINLLPLPILDGGRLLFLIIEKLKGSPVSERVQNISNRISLILLLLLMGFTFFNDFSQF